MLAGSTRVRRGKQGGFTLVESIVALILAGAILAGAGAFAISIREFRAEERIANGGVQHSVVPSTRELEHAVNYHFVLQQLINRGSAFYVFGGRGEQFAGDPLTAPGTADAANDLGPISIGNEPAIGANLGFSSGTNVVGFVPVLSTCHGARLVMIDSGVAAFDNAVADPADFSVVIVTGIDQVIGVAQVRRQVAGTNIFYRATLTYDQNFAPATLPVSAEAAAFYGNPAGTLEYNCVVGVAEENQGIAPLSVGATHYWYRRDTNFERYQQAAVRVIFPDPFVLQATEVNAGFSRFSYFQSVQL